MKTLMYVLFVLSYANCVQAEDWFCMHEAGKREQDIVWACGVGESTDESDARHKALKDAQREFDEICQMSSDCRERKLNVDPQRTTCGAYNGHIKCYRLLIITLKQ